MLCEGGTYETMISIYFIMWIILTQSCIAFLFYRMGWSLVSCILIGLLPFGISLFLIQIFYYERFYPNWSVPFKTKIHLKYAYLLTISQFIGLYLVVFVFGVTSS